MLDYDELAEHFGSCSMSELFEFEFGERNPTKEELREYIELLCGFSDTVFPIEGKFKLSTPEGRKHYWKTQDVDSWIESIGPFEWCVGTFGIDKDGYINHINTWLSSITTSFGEELGALYEKYEE